jgi:RNase adaptor protein for sRNA GlmZ degradation
MTTQPSPQTPRPADVTITSFGYHHGSPPDAHLTIDCRAHFRDPHIDPAMRHLDATDGQVYARVLETPGTWDLAVSVASAVLACLAGPSAGPVSVAIGCAGGRHRGPSIAIAVCAALADTGVSARVVHRDITRPVVDRTAETARSVAS